MLQLIKFFKDNRVFLLFVLLEFVALVFIINSHSYHNSKYVHSANYISGSILKKSNTISNYFKLKKQNKTLAEENEFLKNNLEKLNKTPIVKDVEIVEPTSKYHYINATVISNPYTKRNNILTLDKGSQDSIQPNMGVVLSNGVVGITLKVSKHYTTVLSLLNSQSKINAKMKKSHHYGSLHWKGKDPYKVNLDDLPIQANVQGGDTIISGGKSIFFPEGIPIGVISDFTIDNKSYSDISIDLFADFSALNSVYVVKNKLGEEQLQLETESIDE